MIDNWQSTLTESEVRQIEIEAVAWYQMSNFNYKPTNTFFDIFPQW